MNELEELSEAVVKAEGSEPEPVDEMEYSARRAEEIATIQSLAVLEKVDVSSVA